MNDTENIMGFIIGIPETSKRGHRLQCGKKTIYLSGREGNELLWTCDRNNAMFFTQENACDPKYSVEDIYRLIAKSGINTREDVFAEKIFKQNNLFHTEFSHSPCQGKPDLL
jgi:hypothetical protein